jgi:hypothetical protein
MANEFPGIAHDMREVYQRFERLQRARTERLPNPKRLWVAAELARGHGVFRVEAGGGRREGVGS